MIKCDRGALPATIKVYAVKSVKALDGVTKVTRAEQELEKAVAFFSNPANYAGEAKLTKETFPFAVYKDPELVAVLEAAFGNKCVYCESDFGHVTPKDIEHFRPKSEISADAATLRPGYYWLAGDWDNLLVSCPDCNRARKHSVPGQPKRVKLGKETQFPLSDEKHRARNRMPIGSEEGARLLLNPCVDQPADHLTFDNQALVHSRPDAAGHPSPMGTVSIAVYALQRKGLVEKRLEVLNSFRHEFDQLNYLVKNHNTLKGLGASAGVLAANAAQIRAVKDEIRSMLDGKAQYLAMLGGWIRQAQRKGGCALLEQFGINLTKLIP